MSIESRILAELMASPAITSVIGDRFYSFKFPQNVQYPAGVQNRISTVPASHLGGSATLDSVRVQIDWYSTDGAGLLSLARAVQLTLEAASPPIMLRGQYSGFEPDAQNLGDGLYRVTQDFAAWDRYN